MKQRFSRRQWLRGAGAAVAASPFVASLAAPGLDRRAFAQSAGSPQRLVCWPMMNGAEASYFFANPGNLAAMSMITEPLKKWANQVTFVKGVNVSGSVNHYAVRSIFSGAGIGNYESADPSVKSIDQIVADSMTGAAATKIKSMHLGAVPADSINYYMRAGRSTLFFAPAPVNYEANPVTAFDRFFGGGGAPAGPGNALTPAADFTNDSLDLLDAEMAELGARLGNSGEVAKLGLHREALKGLRPKAELPGSMQMPVSTSGTLASVEKLRPMLQGNAKDAYKHAYFSDVYDAQIDIMARALVTGQTKVATLQAGSADNNVIVPVDKGYPHHNTSHGNQAIYSKCVQWYFGKLARLAQALDVPDPLAPGKTVLENTVILVMAECLPVSHSSNGVPTLLLGTGGGKIKPGFVSGSYTNKMVMASVLKAFGLPGGHFGATVISELLA